MAAVRDPKGLAVVVGATVLPFVIVVSGTVCTVAAVRDPRGLALVVGATMLPFTTVDADAVGAGAPIVAGAVGAVVPDALHPPGRVSA
ncbi:hypothetical protein [Mycobacterium sp. 1274761.0]|uniref:hypothetical protein n=1 Tax=Mycobacterium sp. 1274761.0 TaxID=1834077 RepID=UPI0012E8D481|nr:hypothetical protein [Mycobacterium sp. 1274761.0]